MIVIDAVIKFTITINMPLATIAQMVYHYLVTSAGSATVAEVSDRFNDQVETAFAFIESILPTNVDWAETDMAIYNPATEQFDGVYTRALTGTQGTSANEMGSHGVAAVLRHPTLLARRQGRKFVPGIVETSITDSVIAAAALAALGNYGVEMADPIGTLGTVLQPGVWSPTLGFEPFEPTVIVNAITGYQRRRKPGVGI